MKYQFILCNSLEKVFPNDKPHAAESSQFTVLQNESLHFQIAIYLDLETGRNIGDLRFEYKLPEEIAKNIKAFRLEYVPVMTPVFHHIRDEDYLFDQAQLAPDVLEPIANQQIKAADRQWRAVWFELAATEDLAGSYPGSILFYDANGEEVGEVELSIEVIDLALDKQEVLHTEWFHADCLADYYQCEVFSEKHWEIVENFIHAAVRSGVNMLFTPLFTPPLDTVEGGERRTVQLLDIKYEKSTYYFDFSKLQRWIDIALAQGIEYFEMVHLFTQWGARHAPKIMAEVDGSMQRIFGWETDATGPEYREFLHSLLPQLKEFLAKQNLLDRTYFHISDEPRDEHLESYRAAKEVVNPLLEGCHVIDALSNFDYYKLGIIDKPVPASNHIEPFLEAEVPGLWVYYCNSQAIDVSNRFMSMPQYRTRILGLQLYLHDMEGFLHWGFNFYNAQYSVRPINPFMVTDAVASYPSGDCFIVYPAADGTALDSIRARALAEAFQDHRALVQLEKKIGKAAIKALIHEGLEEKISFSKYPRSAQFLIDLRNKVNFALQN